MQSIADLAKLDSFIDFYSIGRSCYSYALIRPTPKQSVQFGKGFAFTPTKVRQYLQELKNQLNQNWSSDIKLNGAIKAQVVFSYKFLQKEKVIRFKTTRPDIDNLLKPLNDSLSLVLEDDAQIAALETHKIHSEFEFIYIKLQEITYKDSFLQRNL